MARFISDSQIANCVANDMLNLEAYSLWSIDDFEDYVSMSHRNANDEYSANFNFDLPIEESLRWH